jgi:hypothetical protein
MDAITTINLNKFIDVNNGNRQKTENKIVAISNKVILNFI